MSVIHMSLISIISVYWAAWNSSEFVIPQRRDDLWLLLLPVRILYNIPERSSNTPFIHSLSLVDKRRGENRILFSPSILSLIYVYFCCLDQRMCIGSSIYDRLIERVLLCSVFSETLDASWIWTFPKTCWVNIQNFAQ